MPRRKVIAASLKARGALILTRDLEEACAVANRIAPEHLELAVREPGSARCRSCSHAGAIFLGRWSSEAIGDYCAGPNHVLPTAGTARFSSPLGVYDFQKRTSVIGGFASSGAPRWAESPSTLARGRRPAPRTRAPREMRIRMKPRRSRPAGDPRAQGLSGAVRRRHGEARRDGESLHAAARRCARELAAVARARRRQPLSDAEPRRSCATRSRGAWACRPAWRCCSATARTS